MFGHDDQQTNTAAAAPTMDQTIQPTSTPAVNVSDTPDPGMSNMTASQLIQPDPDDGVSQIPGPMIKPDVDATLPEPSLPSMSSESEDLAVTGEESDTPSTTDFPQPALSATSVDEPDTITPTAPQMPSVSDTTSVPPADTSDDDLLDIKQEALQQLSPLVDHLDQTAEEKFHTTMMMIQASDDQSLIPQAFDSAKQITDDKVRAQALLDIINEINYFTTQHPGSTDAPA